MPYRSRENPATSVYLKWTRLDDLIFQITGNDTEKMQESAAKLEGYGPFGIDINMGAGSRRSPAMAGAQPPEGPLKGPGDPLRSEEGGEKTVIREDEDRLQPDVKAMLEFASMLVKPGPT
jgi:hypothetical protein